MIQKLFATFLLLSLHLFGMQYNSTIIELEAKLFPKMLMLSENIDQKSPTLEITIVTKESSLYDAKIFKKAIEQSYPERLIEKKVIVDIKEFSQLNSHPDAIVVLYHSHEELKKIAAWANSRKIPSFAYDPAHLEHGILASLYIGTTTKPYLNKSVLNRYNFSFSSYLLKLSKFYK